MSKHKQPTVQQFEPRLRLSPDEMRRQLIAREQSDAQQCANEVAAVLAKWNCQMQIVQVFVNGQQQQMQVQYVKLPPPQNVSADIPQAE